MREERRTFSEELVDSINQAVQAKARQTQVSKRTEQASNDERKPAFGFFPVIFATPAKAGRGDSVELWTGEMATALKAKRQASGLSQEKLAVKAGLDRQRYSWIEYPKSAKDSGGTVRPSKSELKAILDALS